MDVANTTIIKISDNIFLNTIKYKFLKIKTTDVYTWANKIVQTEVTTAKYAFL